MGNDQFLTPKEVANRLQLNLPTIYKYIRNKKIPAVRFGRNYRIAQIDLETFLNANKTI
jgi:excisionase family DNA binding protein